LWKLLRVDFKDVDDQAVLTMAKKYKETHTCEILGFIVMEIFVLLFSTLTPLVMKIIVIVISALATLFVCGYYAAKTRIYYRIPRNRLELQSKQQLYDVGLIGLSSIEKPPLRIKKKKCGFMVFVNLGDSTYDFPFIFASLDYADQFIIKVTTKYRTEKEVMDFYGRGELYHLYNDITQAQV
jgi:hypothetical protein